MPQTAARDMNVPILAVNLNGLTRVQVNRLNTVQAGSVPEQRSNARAMSCLATGNVQCLTDTSRLVMPNECMHHQSTYTSGRAASTGASVIAGQAPHTFSSSLSLARRGPRKHRLHCNSSVITETCKQEWMPAVCNWVLATSARGCASKPCPRV